MLSSYHFSETLRTQQHEMAGNPTSAAQPAPEPTQGPLYVPLMIAFCIIVSAAMTLSAIHFFLTQLCRRRHQHGNSVASGKKTTEVNKKLLKSIPIYAYSKNMSDCRLSNCGHIFHVDCVDAWFELHPTCPFCRTVATPPQSLVAPWPFGYNLMAFLERLRLRCSEAVTSTT